MVDSALCGILQTGICFYKDEDIHTDRQEDRQTDRQTDEIERQTDRQTLGWTDRQRQTHIHHLLGNQASS